MRHPTPSRPIWSTSLTSPGSGVARFGRRQVRFILPSHASKREESAVDQSEAPRERQSLVSTLAEKAELGVQGAFALAFGAALVVSAANILVKVGVITFALVTVAARYTIVGIFLAVIIACIL